MMSLLLLLKLSCRSLINAPVMFLVAVAISIVDAPVFGIAGAAVLVLPVVVVVVVVNVCLLLYFFLLQSLRHVVGCFALDAMIALYFLMDIVIHSCRSARFLC